MIKRNEHKNKQQIISEYLSGDATFEQLGQKYGLPLRTIQSWVRSYRKRTGSAPAKDLGAKADIKFLKKQLEEAQLKNELLEEMLRLSAQQTGIDIRKKYGTRQS
jgi:transposase-like protein